MKKKKRERDRDRGTDLDKETDKENETKRQRNGKICKSVRDIHREGKQTKKLRQVKETERGIETGRYGNEWSYTERQ